MTSFPTKPLLASLLAALALPGCEFFEESHREDVSYVPGVTPVGDTGTPMPAGACLPKEDPQLKRFNPSCDNQFAVVDGPEEATDDKGVVTCTYTIVYTVNDNCQIGRPLSVDDAPRTAPLLVGARGWS